MNLYSKIRLTFILIGEISVTALISTIVLATILYSNSRIDSRADDMIALIYRNPNGFDNGPGAQQEGDPAGPSVGDESFAFEPPAEGSQGETPEGSFPPPPDGSFPENPGQDPNWPFFPGGDTPPFVTDDILFGLRYFTVTTKPDGSREANVNFIYAFTEEEALIVAEQAANSGKTKGYYKDYRFNTFKNGDVSQVIFLDWSNQLEPGRYFANIALIVGGIGAGLSLAVLLAVSGLITKPLAVANEKQKKFISDASHELKTPLAIISANNEIIEMIYGKDEATEAISKQVSKMTDMIRSFSALAKLGEVSRSDFVQLNLSDICIDLASEFEPAFTRAGINFKSSIQEGFMIKGSESELRKMISTILDNARKYSKSFCHFTLYRSNKGMTLRVKNDTAEPLVPGPMNRVFDRFYRTDDARGSKVEGSGIGLSLAKEIALLHKASISCYVSEEKEFVMRIDF